MKEMTRPVGGLTRLPSAVAVAVALLPASAAQSAIVERLSVAVTGSSSFATNPFLQESGDTAAALVELSVEPRYLLTFERGSAAVEGSFRATQYLARYGGSSAYGVRTSGQYQLSEAATLSAQAAAQSSLIGEDRAFGRDSFGELPETGQTPLDPDGGLFDPVDPLDPDLGLLGSRARRNSLTAGIGFQTRLNQDNEINVSAEASKTSFSGEDSGIGSRSFAATAGYSRRVSATASAGLNLGVQHSRFAQGGTSTAYQPQLTYIGQVYPGWEITVAGGGLFIRSDLPVIGKQQVSGFSGEIEACRSGTRNSLCFGAARGAQESGRGAINERLSVFAQFARRLSEREELRFSGALASVDEQQRESSSRTRQQSLDVDYSLRLREWWEISAGAGYRDVLRADRATKADLRAQLTVRMRLDR